MHNINDVLLKFTFCTGLLLIIFHSIIFHFIKQDEKPAQQSSHSNIPSVKQNKNSTDYPLIPKTNNTANRISQTTSNNKKTIYKNTKSKKFSQPDISQKNKQRLSDQYIETVLNRQKRFFKTCYIRHLKNNLASKGSIILSFNIDSPGTVSDVSIQGGSIKDKILHKCMKKVVERVTFRHFSGPLTKVFYPIEFH